MGSKWEESNRKKELSALASPRFKKAEKTGNNPEIPGKS